MSGKEKFLFKSFVGQAEEQLFFRNTFLSFTILKSSLNFPISLSKLILIPSQGGPSFLYIVAWIASQPSTWRIVDLSLDTCLIFAMLVAVE